MTRLQRILLAITAVSIAAGLVLWLTRLFGKSLLDRATEITNVRDWTHGRWSYEWLSDHEILFFRGGNKGAPPTAYRFNTETGIQSEDTSLTLALRTQTPGLVWSWPDLFDSVSPDGKWILWKD